jgi:hypothetical protein
MVIRCAVEVYGHSSFLCLCISESGLERSEKAGMKGRLQCSRSVILDAERIEAFKAVEPVRAVEGWRADHQ